MRILHKAAGLAAAALMSLSLTLLASEAEAGRYRRETYRVVGVAGSDMLQLMSAPGHWSDLVAEVPFDGRGLSATGAVRGGWMQVAWESDGEVVTGWARREFLARDNRYQPTVFRLVPGSGSVKVRLQAGEAGSVIGIIPPGATGLKAYGDCQDGYCAVSYGRGRWQVDGWVRQDLLVVAGGRTRVAYADQDAPLPLADVGQDDWPYPDGGRRGLWNDILDLGNPGAY